MVYPENLRVDHVDLLHDVEVSDPYRWLEKLDSKQTQAWIAARNELSGAVGWPRFQSVRVSANGSYPID